MKQFFLTTTAILSLLMPVSGYAASAHSPAAISASPVQPGQHAYDETFENFYSRFQLLADAPAAAAFKAAWEHKFDKTGDLTTQTGTEKAIEAMAQAASMLGCPQKFDGKCLYARAFTAYMQFHYNPLDGSPNLADPGERAKWAAEWEHKFDNTGDLTTEDGTDSAIRKMRDSLQQRFDYVVSAEGTTAEHEKMKAKFAGIGVPVSINNGEKLAFGAPIELVAHEPGKNSPAYGLVHFRDVVVSIDGQPIDGMTIDAAIKKFEGPVGSHVKLTVRRKDAQGVDQLVDIDITRGYTLDALSSVTPHGDAGIGVPFDVTHRDDIKLGAGFEMRAGKPFDGSPSQGKIMDGDLIVKVDGVDLSDKTLSQAVDLVRGTPGTKVTLTVVRKDEDGRPHTLAVDITRRAIEQHAVHFKPLADGLSYIKLDQFEAQNVPDDMAVAYARAILPLASKAMRAKGLANLTGPDAALSLAMAERFDALKRILDNGGKLSDETMAIVVQARQVYDENPQGGGIIVDLRHDPGGDLQVLRAVASMTLPSGVMMVRSERDPGTDKILENEDILTPNFEVLAAHPAGASVDEMQPQATARMPLLVPSKMPMVVLIDEYSASASELFSGTLQGNHRAVIVGQPSLGKGVGQSLVGLPYGRSLHVTNFEFLPAGMKSDWIGVIPDLIVKAAEEGDPQQDAAVAELKRLDQMQVDRAAAVAASLTRHHGFFNGQMQDRSDEDSKPLSDQDKSRLD